MNLKIFVGVITPFLVILSVLIAGCTSYAPSIYEPSLPLASPNKMSDLAIGDTATISGPHGNLEVTLSEIDIPTGKILIEEKNTGTDSLQYEPKIWLHDGDGVNYTTIYCRADVCPGYVFITTLPSNGIEKREFDNLFDTFRVPEQGRHGNLIMYWSDYGQTASWIIPIKG